MGLYPGWLAGLGDDWVAVNSVDEQRANAQKLHYIDL